MSHKRWTASAKRRLAPSTQDRELHEAIGRQDWDEVQEWLDAGAARDLMTPLLGTMVSGCSTTSSPTKVTATLNGLSVLLDRFDQDLHEVSRTGFTALRSAVLYAHVEVLDLVLRRGANPNERYRQGTGFTTPWLENFAEGHRPLAAVKAERLWRAGADIDARDPEGRDGLALFNAHRASWSPDRTFDDLKQVWHQAHEARILRATLDDPKAKRPMPAVRRPRRL